MQDNLSLSTRYQVLSTQVMVRISGTSATSKGASHENPAPDTTGRCGVHFTHGTILVGIMKWVVPSSRVCYSNSTECGKELLYKIY